MDILTSSINERVKLSPVSRLKKWRCAAFCCFLSLYEFWEFKFSATFYFHSTRFWRQMFYFSLQHTYVLTLVTSLPIATLHHNKSSAFMIHVFDRQSEKKNSVSDPKSSSKRSDNQPGWKSIGYYVYIYIVFLIFLNTFIARKWTLIG